MRFTLCFFLLGLVGVALRAEPAALSVSPHASPRVQYGVERLRAEDGPAMVIGPIDDPDVRRHLAAAKIEVKPGELKPQGFLIARGVDTPLIIAGADDTGTMYGCLEVAARTDLRAAAKTPLRLVENPTFVLRGPCIGLQKTAILPGRHVYEYPYTPELFPFFYEREFWREYLDFLADNRFNTLFLWNGHPFGSLVKLDAYPEALEVPEDVFKRNVEMFHYITEECDRRGIWLVQMFYNIFLPQPLAEKHGLPTQLSRSNPLAADYTRKAIAEFVKQYPNVGLMPTLGEALQGTPNQIEWATKVILPGVLDGMKAAGRTEQPPVVFRTHAMDPEKIIPAAFKVYDNLFTETKFNGESLTTWEPRGKSQATHLAMAKLGPHLVNVHILANLEPFRYGATEFIRKSVVASRDRLGATGLHLYPLAYWNWPDSPDKAAASGALPTEQWERDWIWFEAWARYAWNPDRDPGEDRAHWVSRLAERYGTSAEAAGLILDAYNDSGECAPMIIRRFGITEGNRQTMSLGMTLDQLVNPVKYGVIADLYESQAPPGERLPDYVEKEFRGEPHVGETPPQVARDVVRFSERAVAALEKAAPQVTRNRAEFERLRNDAAAIAAMSANYAAKANAALHVLRFKLSGDVADLEKARGFLAESLRHFRTLERLTRDTYHFANSMQTAHRRIPNVGAMDGAPVNFHWSQLLPVYEKELADFEAQVAAIKRGGSAAARALARVSVQPVRFTVHTPGAESFTLKADVPVFTDGPYEIEELAPELEGVKGIRFPHQPAKSDRYQPVEFSVDQPVRVLIGYVRNDDPQWRKPPRQETDAAAVERGGVEPLIVDAAKISGLPEIDVYELNFPAGRHKIEPTGSGAFLILGVVTANAKK